MPKTASGSAANNSPNPDLVYLNGIDPETGAYAVAPAPIDNFVTLLHAKPPSATLAERKGDVPRSFSVPFGIDLTNLGDVGWGIILHEDTPKDIRDALTPLIEHRRTQAGDLLQELDYKKGEQIRDWYTRHHIGAGTFEPSLVPYYLLLVGPPTEIPFEFEYLIAVEYAVGRLSFETVEEYARYAASIVAYEKAESVRNRKEIVYWGTQHPGDPATEMSATLLIDPLVNGSPAPRSVMKKPVNSKVNFEQKVFSGDDAVREALLSTFHRDQAPALVFTASHGISIKAGGPNQATDNGALLCQDWQGIGPVKREQYLAAADITDDANVGGVVAFLFACFGGGTPDVDQFLMDLADAGTAPALAPKPFVAALPQRLLAHPKGSALAVIAHIDRAWSFSIKPDRSPDSQIGPFYNGLCFVLNGVPVGHAISQQFGQRFSVLCTTLLAALAPTTPVELRPSDRILVTSWLERNDAQNYVVLGDPAVRIRTDVLAS